MEEPKNIVFTEKYRPKRVEDVVGNTKNKILPYLANPSSIQNFLFYSISPGTGKCVAGDEMFLTEKGFTTFEEYSNKIDAVEGITPKKESVYDIENNFVNASYFYKGKSDIIKIKSKIGIELSCTREHKIKVFDIEQGFIWKRKCDMNKDTDFIPIFFNTNIFGNVVDLPEYKYKKNIRDNNSFDIKIPMQLNKDLSYLLGLIVANASKYENSICISTFKPILQDIIINLCKNVFGFEAICHINNGKQEGVRINSCQIISFLEECCGYEFTTARYKAIPKIIFKTTKDNQMWFLYGLFEDANFSDRDLQIEYLTASEKLSKQVQILGLNLGLIFTRRDKKVKKYDWNYKRMRLSVEHSKKFIDYFNGYFKNDFVGNMFKEDMNTNFLTYRDIIKNFVKYKFEQTKTKKEKSYDKKLRRLGFNRAKKNIYGFLKYDFLKPTLEMFIKHDIFLDKLDSIEEKTSQVVYDFHIPYTHSFLCNGIINHNTTMAKAIINNLGCDALFINSSDDRTLDVVRETVKLFAMTQSSKEGMRKCIFMDEFDGNTKLAQDALRNIMETYSRNVFFILTCNNVNKVIDPIKSRCIVIQFANPEKVEIVSYLKQICENETMAFTEEGLKTLVNKMYPSIRNCVVFLQDLYTLGKAVVPENIITTNDVYEVIYSHLKARNIEEMKKILFEKEIDFEDFNSFLWHKAVETNNIKLIITTGKNEKDFRLGCDNKIVFLTSIYELLASTK